MLNAIKNFLDYAQIERRLAHNTIIALQNDLLKLHQLYPNLQLKNLNNTHLENYICKFPGAKSTLMRRKSSINCFLNFINQEYNVHVHNLYFKSPKGLPKTLPYVLTINEFERFINKIQKPRDVALFETLIATGCRVSEIVSLTKNHIDFKDGTVLVHGKGNKERIIPITTIARKRILNWIAWRAKNQHINSDYIFTNSSGNPITRKTVYILTKKYAHAAHITKAISPHTFRHTFATWLLNNGVDLASLQSMLGHADLQTTAWYIHLDISDIIKTVELYHPINTDDNLCKIITRKELEIFKICEKAG